MINVSYVPIGKSLYAGGSMFKAAPFSPIGRKEPAPAPAPAELGRKQLGANEQEWFARAKAAIAQYDELWATTQQIANKTYREQLASKYHTTPEDKDGALYRRNSVAYNISQAESYTPVNYLVFQSQQQNRVSKLEAWNEDFKEDVEYGAREYGMLEAPQIIEQVKMVTETQAPPWLLPAGLGLGAFVLGLALFKS